MRLTPTDKRARRTSAPIQQLFAWRIKQFTHSWWIFTLLCTLSLISFTLAIATAVYSLLQHRYG